MCTQMGSLSLLLYLGTVSPLVRVSSFIKHPFVVCINLLHCKGKVLVNQWCSSEHLTNVFEHKLPIGLSVTSTMP